VTCALVHEESVRRSVHDGYAIDAAAVHAVQHQAVQVDVEIGGRPEALDQRDGAALAFVGDEPGSGQQHAQRNRQRQDPLAHRHAGNDKEPPRPQCMGWDTEVNPTATLDPRSRGPRPSTWHEILRNDSAHVQVHDGVLRSSSGDADADVFHRR